VGFNKHFARLKGHSLWIGVKLTVSNQLM